MFCHFSVNFLENKVSKAAKMALDGPSNGLKARQSFPVPLVKVGPGLIAKPED